MSSSLFTNIDADRRRWQHNNLRVLTDLVNLGEANELPPLLWTLSVHTLTGKADPFGDVPPREAFEAWHDALLNHVHISTRGTGLDRDQPYRRERVDSYGQTSLLAAFEHKVPHRLAVDVCLLAEWFEDEQ